VRQDELSPWEVAIRKCIARTEDHAINGISLVLAVPCSSPWLAGLSGEQTAAWTAWISGALIAIVAAIALAELRQWEEWVNGLPGLFVAVSPWILGFAGLGRAHDVLTRDNWDGADLLAIVAQAVAPYTLGRQRPLHVTGPDVGLTPRLTLALAMALHELATNAVKYGALSTPTGEIRITWTVEETTSPRRLCLRWQEADGPPVQPPAQRGFGTRLIERSLAQDLDGNVRIDFAREGIICIVDAPLPGATAERHQYAAGRPVPAP